MTVTCYEQVILETKPNTTQIKKPQKLHHSNLYIFITINNVLQQAA